MLNALLERFRPQIYPLFNLKELTEGRSCPAGSLDLRRRVITVGRKVHGFGSVDSISTFPVSSTAPALCNEYLGIKLSLGPVLCLEAQPDRLSTKDLGERVTRLLGKRGPVFESSTRYYLFDPVPVLPKSVLQGSVSLTEVRFTEQGVILPVTLCINHEDFADCVADVVIDRAGIVLYNGMGEPERLGDFSMLKDINDRYQTIMRDQSENRRVTLVFFMEPGPRMEFGYNFATLHDDPIEGEAAEARRETREVDAIVRRILKTLGFAVQE